MMLAEYQRSYGSTLSDSKQYFSGKKERDRWKILKNEKTKMQIKVCKKFLLQLM